MCGNFRSDLQPYRIVRGKLLEIYIYNIMYVYIIPGIPVCRSTVYVTLSHPPGAIFRAQLLDSEEDASAEQYTFGKLSAYVSSPDLFGTESIPAVEMSSGEDRPRGGVIAVSYTHLTLPTIYSV